MFQAEISGERRLGGEQREKEAGLSRTDDEERTSAMTADLADFRLVVGPGDGIVMRRPGIALVALPVGERQQQTARRLIDLADSSDPLVTGRLTARRIAVFLADHPSDALPSFGVIVSAGGSCGVLLYGAVDAVVVRGRDEERLSGRSAAAFVDRVIETPFDTIAIGLSNGLPANGDWSAAAWPYDLLEGVVPGGSVILIGAEFDRPITEASSAADQGLLAHSVDPGEEPTRLIPMRIGATSDAISGRTSERPSEANGPVLVTGHRCRDGHFNDPQLRHCSICGLGMNQATLVDVVDARPPLGEIFVGESVYILDHDYIVGREPERDPRVQNNQAGAVVINDNEFVSRVQFAIELDGWDITVVDERSANGTFIATDGGQSWTRIEPKIPIVIGDGDLIRLTEGSCQDCIITFQLYFRGRRSPSNGQRVAAAHP